jgi:predicted permease
LKFRDSWKLSGTVYREVAYRSIQMSRGQSQGGLSSSSSQDIRKQFDSVIGSAKISKIAFAVLGTIGSAFPFLEYLVAPTPEALISGVSLSLAISLAYIVFYSLQILPSFSGGEPYSILLTLPVKNKEFSFIATLSLIRTFDYIAATATTVQVLSVWLLTHSLLASILMLGGSIINIVFAMGLSLWLSGIFYKNTSRGGRRSKMGTIGRSLFVIGWGLAALSIGFIFNFVSYLLPYLTGAVLGMFTRPFGLLLLVIHPFSIGFTIADVVYPSLFASIPLPPRTVLLVPRFLPPILALVATLAYFMLAVFLFNRTVGLVSNVTRGLTQKISRLAANDFLLRVRSPFSAYVLKDLRLSAMNPSLAFLYAAPLFEILTLAVITVQFPVMRASAMIVSTMVGCFFTTMICSTLLNTEGAGFEYTMSLPLCSRTIINAKAVIAALTFVPVPISLLAIALSKHVVSDYVLLIPFAEQIAVFAACLAEIAFFLRPLSGKNSLTQSRSFSVMAGSDIKRLMKSLAIAFAVLALPILFYSVTYLRTFDHALSSYSMIAVSVIELLVTFALIRRTLS